MESRNQPSIVIVDDDPIQRHLLALFAERLSLGALIVTSGQEALEVLDNNPGQFRLVLMDVRMDEIDGLECTRQIRLRERGTGQRIPIIAVTACAMKGDREMCIDAGMDDYLSKPFSLAQLDSLIDLWVGRREPEPPKRVIIQESH